MATHSIIYDGNCNLCTTLVQLLEQVDQGLRFQYIPMQDEATLQTLGISATECEQGMILLEADNLERRWQGSDAAEEIGNLLPLGQLFVQAYRALPGVKWTGDRIYSQVRDHRYALFGRRVTTYQSIYSLCSSETCAL
jgi:predicted DCC family thiol-disulfide oxidoreductase YuxK